MTAAEETLTVLVRDRVGDGRPMTYRAFHARTVDPETGHRPSTHTIGRIINGDLVKISPALVRAIAAGLGMPDQRVAIAAARQYIGLDVSV